jgi:CRP/FNR family cyclic AMP-dependent transcriptional regulator
VIENFLRSVELFGDLEDDELAHVLMAGMMKRYRPGNAIVTEGVQGGHLYVVKQGQVRLSKHVPGAGEEALTILGPGEIFGVVEFFDGAVPSVHAIAHTECDVLAIPHGEVRQMMTTDPVVAGKFLWALGRTLARRVREGHQRMASLFAISRDF